MYCLALHGMAWYVCICICRTWEKPNVISCRPRCPTNIPKSHQDFIEGTSNVSIVVSEETCTAPNPHLYRGCWWCCICNREDITVDLRETVETLWILKPRHVICAEVVPVHRYWLARWSCGKCFALRRGEPIGLANWSVLLRWEQSSIKGDSGCRKSFGPGADWIWDLNWFSSDCRAPVV